LTGEAAVSTVTVASRGFREPGVDLGSGVHAIGPSKRGQFQGGYSRAYLFEHDDGLALVDTLWDHDAHMILRYLWQIGHAPTDITDILISHAHRSHLGGVAILKHLTGATVHSHALEAPIVAGRESAAKIPLWPLVPPQLIGFRIASQLGIQPHMHCEVDDPTLEGGEDVCGLEVIHLPGHTRGNLAFSWKDDRAIAVADTVMTWPSFCAGWPGFNHDDAEFRRSLQKVVERRPEMVLTGHGNPIWENAAETIETLL
jgi:glyoxylase-like metal-dependent hydrolase (beta-lactamase superfamily II)